MVRAQDDSGRSGICAAADLPTCPTVSYKGLTPLLTTTATHTNRTLTTGTTDLHNGAR